jgi:hypothetical protein
MLTAWTNIQEICWGITLSVDTLEGANGPLGHISLSDSHLLKESRILRHSGWLAESDLLLTYAERQRSQNHDGDKGRRTE